MIIVNMLADSIFKYQIILSGKTILLITVFNSYIFNLSIDLQYNNIKFIRLFIDLEGSTQFIEDIGQFKTL